MLYVDFVLNNESIVTNISIFAERLNFLKIYLNIFLKNRKLVIVLMEETIIMILL